MQALCVRRPDDGLVPEIRPVEHDQVGGARPEHQDVVQGRAHLEHLGELGHGSIELGDDQGHRRDQKVAPRLRRHLGAEEARHELPDLGHEASAVGHARGKGVQGGLRGVVVGLGTAGTQNAGEARDKHVALPDRVHLEGTVLAEALGDHEDVLHVVEDGVLSQQGSEGVALGHRREQDHDRCARVREVRHGVRAGHDARLGPLDELGDEALLHDSLAAASRKLK